MTHDSKPATGSDTNLNATNRSDSADVGAAPASKFRPLRAWPPVVLIAAMVVARFVPSWFEDGPSMLWMVAAFGPLLACLLLLIWWLAVSRARWQERLAGFFGLIAIAVVSIMLADRSMQGPATSMFTIPVGIGSFGVGAFVTRNLLSFRRTGIALLLSLAGFACSLTLRADGVWGDFHIGLHWRWEKSAEERMLTDRSSKGDSPKVAVADEDWDRWLASPEWPGFRGADRSGRQRGVKFSADWNAHPPRLLWKIDVGPAWSAFAVAGKLLFTQEQRGPLEVVVCYDADSGREIWVRSIESRFDEPLGGPGPRATPTLADGGLFVQGAAGDVMRLDPKTGEIIWRQDLRKLAERAPPMWGFSSSPLVTHGVVVVHAAGKEDKGVIALAADDGRLRWSTAAGEHSYSSPHLLQLGDDQLIGITSNTGLDLLDPTTGQARLRYDWTVQQYRALQPTVVDAESLLLPTGMGAGTRRLKLAKAESGDSITAQEVWTSRNLKPDFNDIVVHDGYIYGFDAAMFTCIDLKDGSRKWKGGRYGKGQALLLADSNLLLIVAESGELALVRATPDRFEELAKIPALEGKTWNHMVVVGDCLYLRNAAQAACYQLTTE